VAWVPGSFRTTVSWRVMVPVQVPLATLRSMAYAYPTFHRAVEDAVHRLG